MKNQTLFSELFSEYDVFFLWRLIRFTFYLFCSSLIIKFLSMLFLLVGWLVGWLMSLFFFTFTLLRFHLDFFCTWIEFLQFLKILTYDLLKYFFFSHPSGGTIAHRPNHSILCYNHIFYVLFFFLFEFGWFYWLVLNFTNPSAVFGLLFSLLNGSYICDTIIFIISIWFFLIVCISLLKFPKY